MTANRRLTKCVIFVLAFGLTAGIANAELIAYEPFDYAPASDLDGQNGGEGWAGPWNCTGEANMFIVGTGNLVHPTLPIPVEGGHGILQGGDHTRPLPAGTAVADGTTYWFSALFQSVDGVGDAWTGPFGWDGNWCTEPNDMTFWCHSLQSEFFFTWPDPSDVHWIVLKFETTAGGGILVYGWLDPDPGPEPAIQDAEGSQAMGFFDDFFWIAEAWGDDPDFFYIDEIRLATSFADLAPIHNVTQDTYHYTIQDAIDDAVNGDTIIVKDGTYTGTGNKNIDFGGLAIILQSQNGPENCIIDCEGNGRGFIFENSETSASVVDGFTITNGYATATFGGGIYCNSGSPTISNCIFSNNFADHGGGMFNVHPSNPTITNCAFIGNSANINGGGMWNFDSNPILTNCTFTGNSANNQGGGMHNGASSPTLTNCTFTANSAGVRGGGMWNWESSSPTVTNCTFSGNSAGDYGGGMYNSNSSPTISNCTFSGNSASQGGGLLNVDSSPTLTNCTFSYNSAVIGGGIRSLSSSPKITNCTFSGNSASNSGGGMTNEFSGSPMITNCTFSGNSGSFWAGGMYNSSSSPIVTNCTFSSNSAGDYGGGMYNADGSPTLTNCILWGNTAPTGPQIRNSGTSSPTVTFSDVQGGYSGIGNIDADPLFEPDNYHLQFGSPCIDAGDPNGIYTGQTDIDGEPRTNGPVDIGADEFHPPIHNVDQDTYYFTIQDAINDANDGETIIARPKTYTGTGNRDIDFLGKAITLQSQSGLENCIIDCEGNGRGFIFENSETSTSVVDGFTITNANPGDVGGGVYCNGSSPTIKNCILSNNVAVRGGGMYNDYSDPNITNCTFSANSALHGGGMVNMHCSPTLTNCTFSGNSVDFDGGGMDNYDSSPAVTECTFSGNSAGRDGGGMFNEASSNPTVTNCTFSGNSPDGIHIDNTSTTQITGTVQIISNDVVGEGTLQIDSDATLEVQDSGISSDISGTGVISVPFGKEVAFEGDAAVDLSHETDPNLDGEIACNGLMRVRNSATVTNTPIYVVRASFEDNAAIIDNVISVEPGAPSGQIVVKDAVTIAGNDFYANGDRYTDLDPNTFSGTVVDNRYFITITEGAGGTPAGLFELRGDPSFAEPCGELLCQLEPNAIPDCNLATWTLEEIVLVAEAKVILTNRSDYQPPYDSGGEEEVLYVRHLILGQNSILDVAFNRVYYETLQGDPNQIINEPLLGFSLDDINFDDDDEFATRVAQNNFVDPEPDPCDFTRIHVERVEDPESPDPSGLMRMTNLRDNDPCSPNYGEMVNARAKSLFAKPTADEILIRFDYLFGTSDPDVELLVYLSDVPELLAHDAPDRAEHYILVGRLQNPPAGRPGSAGSERFGLFYKFVSCGNLDFSEGMWIELELLEQGGGMLLFGAGMLVESMGSEGGSVSVNNMDVQVHCDYFWECLDITWDDVVNEEDFLTVVGECGHTAELLPDATNSRHCLEGAFSKDGYVDSSDVCSWDWTLNAEDRKDLCYGVPTIEGMPMGAGAFGGFGGPGLLGALPETLSDLLIAGKRGTSEGPTKVKDRLYVFDGQGQYVESIEPASDRCNLRLVQDFDGNLYQVNVETGVYPLDEPNEIIIPPGQLAGVTEPRYDISASTVYVGLQGQANNWWGRPILDVAFDTQGYAYVVPVVVDPNDGDPNTTYIAAAKLQLEPGESPPYSLVKLYDDPSVVNLNDLDNPNLTGLREIEVNDNGSVYVINSHSHNESDILFRYGPGETIEHLDLVHPDSGIFLPAPIAMHVSNATGILYLASAQNPEDANSTIIYGLSTDTFNVERSITVNGMAHVTGITEDLATGNLWVAGFTLQDSYVPDPYTLPYYDPYLAVVPEDSNNVPAVCISDANDLAMPLSIVWTGDICEGADLNNSGDVSFPDFAILALQWLQPPGTPSADIAPEVLDDFVDMRDLAILADHWLETGCLQH